MAYGKTCTILRTFVKTRGDSKGLAVLRGRRYSSGMFLVAVYALIRPLRRSLNSHLQISPRWGYRRACAVTIDCTMSCNRPNLAPIT